MINWLVNRFGLWVFKFTLGSADAASLFDFDVGLGGAGRVRLRNRAAQFGGQMAAGVRVDFQSVPDRFRVTLQLKTSHLEQIKRTLLYVLRSFCNWRWSVRILRCPKCAVGRGGTRSLCPPTFGKATG